MHGFQRLWVRRKNVSQPMQDLPTEAQTLADFDSKRFLVLTGEPGVGKSTELRMEYTRLKTAGNACVTIDLGRVTTSKHIFEPILEAVDRIQSFPDEPQQHFFIFLDAFDEIVIERSTVIEWISKALREVSSDLGSIQNTYVRLFTRDVAWSDRHGDYIRAALELEGPAVQLVLQPLTDKQVVEAIGQERADTLSEIYLELIRRPIFLRLFQKAKATDAAHQSVAQLYEQFLRESIAGATKDLAANALTFVRRQNIWHMLRRSLAESRASFLG